MKIGLVLEGGAMRGMYTAGVLDTFLKHSIKVDGIVGVSAGALFGINYVSGQAGRVIRYNKKYNSDKNYMGLRPLLQEGNIINTQYAYHDVPCELDPFDDETYQHSGIPFYAVVTNIENGQAEYMQVKSVFEQADILRASGSMPYVSRPVILDGKKYLDGGIADSIPYEWLFHQGYDKLIVVLTRDIHYRKKQALKPMANFFYHKYPKLVDTMLNRYSVYNHKVEELMEWEKQGKAFIIRPSEPINIKRMEKDPEILQQIYELGIRDAQNRMMDLQTYINS